MKCRSRAGRSGQRKPKRCALVAVQLDRISVRSVFVLTDAPADRLRRLLTVDWKAAERVIQDVRIEEPVRWVEWDDPRLLRVVTAKFGHLPARLVIADISGRAPGDAEALDFVDVVRSAGPCAVFDDWSEEPWSDDELRRGRSRSGRRFLHPA